MLVLGYVGRIWIRADKLNVVCSSNVTQCSEILCFISKFYFLLLPVLLLLLLNLLLLLLSFPPSHPPLNELKPGLRIYYYLLWSFCVLFISFTSKSLFPVFLFMF